MPSKPSRRTGGRRPGKQAARVPSLRVHWKNSAPTSGSKGDEPRRHYKLETLASATERLLRENDRFIVPSIQGVLGPAPLASLDFELVLENGYRFLFKVGATNAKKKRAHFAFIVAKNQTEYSKLVRNEHEHLAALHPRAPHHILKPYRRGEIFLPDRHQRTAHHREVFAYVMQGLGPFRELGLARDRQFFVNTAPRRKLTRKQNEALKSKLVELIARTYDPAARDCMGIPDVASGDLAATAPRSNPPQLRLMACREVLHRISPARLIHRMIRARWESTGRDAAVVPEDPYDFARGIQKGRGAEEGRTWLREYFEAVHARKLAKSDYMPLSMKDEFGS
ncbi:MAG: hypothetical protein QGG73_05865 [Candidatus Hydrogenedentes bacterium]|jgi:hypothetical protein|nr:hypothetical protein [Candidatus Hydrogenedentota bacterium]